MTWTPSSPLVDRVVDAGAHEMGPRPNGLADIHGIAIHMAEGGGTVSWLTRDDGNSSHYVVEYTGKIVQMVRESWWAGSLNPRLIRLTNDKPYVYLGETITYGRAAQLKVLGSAHASDPNRYVIAIEVEGFAATGPNAKQRTALHALVSDIRRRRGKLGTLGHRDWQSYKPCPGHRIPWIDYGGHAIIAVTTPPPPPTGGPTVAITGSSVPEVPTRLFLRDDPAKAGRSRWLYVWSDHRTDPGNKQLEPQRPLLLTRFIDGDTYAVAYEPSVVDANTTSLEMFVKTVDILRTEPVVGPAVIAAAVKAATDPLNARLAAIKGKNAKIGALVTDIADD
jgi:hypothetical protein